MTGEKLIKQKQAEKDKWPVKCCSVDKDRYKSYFLVCCKYLNKIHMAIIYIHDISQGFWQT